MRTLIAFLWLLNFVVLSGQQQTAFERYISNFEPILKDTLCKTDIVPSRREINKSFVQGFLTKENNCECENGTVWYRYQQLITRGNYLVAFVNKDCDVPQRGYYPFNEIVLYVYTKEGTIIDNKVIARTGDMWEYTLTGTRTPFKLLVEQAVVPFNEWGRKIVHPIACTVETAVWSISEEGKIEKRVLSVKRGAITWNSKEYSSGIIVND